MSSLSNFFKPRAVAVIGATDRPGAVGRTVMENLIQSKYQKEQLNSIVHTGYEIFPINPSRQTVCGIPAFPKVSACPTKIDLAIIVTPAATAKDLVESCGKIGISAVIVISAGFKEIGLEGQQMEKDLIAVAKQHNVRVIGPNCLGLISPSWGLNATFAASNALRGNIAFISQSGAMCTAVLDWSLKERLGFSAFVSIGSMADVHWGDLIDYFGTDNETDLILIYMETIGDVSAFMSAAGSVAKSKPIIVIKAGETEAAAQAAISHTGSLTGSHEAFMAAMKRTGVIVADSIAELFDLALLLGKQPMPRGGNLLIITNAGGPGVLATDAASVAGALIPALEPKTVEALNSFLPKAWSRSNPIDVLGDANADVYARTLEIAFSDNNADGVLVVLSPQSVTEPTLTAEKVVEAYKNLRCRASDLASQKPVFCSWMGGMMVSEGFNYLNANGIPTFAFPDAAARAFGKLWKFNRLLNRRYSFSEKEAVFDNTIEPSKEESKVNEAISILKKNYDDGHQILAEFEAKRILKLFGIPVAEAVVCLTPEEAAQAGENITGYPCVVKLNSNTITHKAAIGGVKININSADEIRSAFDAIKSNVDKIGCEHFQGVSVQRMLPVQNGLELIVGSTVDSQFGPLIMFGAGGKMVEVIKDVALGIPPLTSSLAEILMSSTNIYTFIQQSKDYQNLDLKTLNSIVCKFSNMICYLSDFILECDVNPVLVLPEGAFALDARIVLRNINEDSSLPRNVIRCYPKQHICHKFINNRKVAIRPTCPNDSLAVAGFHRVVLEDPHIRRYFPTETDSDSPLLKIDSVISLCATPDYSRNLPLIVVDDETNEIYCLALISRLPQCIGTAELHIVTRPDVRRKGFATAVLQHILDIGAKESLKRIKCSVPKQAEFLKLAAKFNVKQEPLIESNENSNQICCIMTF